jgi:hypothetical protein
VDYDLYCGPAPKDPLTRRNLHYDWHWVWSTGNGDLGNQGIHQMDIARWALGEDRLPDAVISYGGRVGYVDAGETANTQIVMMPYGKKSLIFEVRGLPTPVYRGATVGNLVEGTDGYVLFTSGGGSTAFDKAGQVVKTFTGQDDAHHFGNFISVVRNRRREELKADCLEGHLSSACCHLGNVSYRLGEPGFASSFRVRSSTSPYSAISMTRLRAVSATTSGSSASTGKLVILSTSALISSRARDASVPSASSASTTPTFSEAADVTRRTPSTLPTPSSTRWTIDCSTSSGDAPGYSTCTWIVSSENSGKTSCRTLKRLRSPATAMKTMRRLAATPFRAIHSIARLIAPTHPPSRAWRPPGRSCRR